jgi:hypothetical protein
MSYENVRPTHKVLITIPESQIVRQHALDQLGGYHDLALSGLERTKNYTQSRAYDSWKSAYIMASAVLVGLRQGNAKLSNTKFDELSQRAINSIGSKLGAAGYWERVENQVGVIKTRR